MFDSLTIRHSETNEAFPYAKTVTEHKAPTDASIQILQEMEAKTRLQIVDRFGATINANFCGIFFNNYDTTLTVHVRLGMLDKHLEISMPRASDRVDMTKVLDKVCDVMGKEIANYLIKEAVKHHFYELRKGESFNVE